MTIGVILVAALTISGAAQDLTGQSGAPAVLFPKPDRPVADIVSPIWHDEKERDDAGEPGQLVRLLGIKSRSQRRFTNISLYFCVMRWMQCPHKPIPKGEMRSVIAIYKTVMLIMMGNAHERGWWPTCLSSEFVSRMTYNPHHMIV
jgi:hypothetical protein